MPFEQPRHCAEALVSRRFLVSPWPLRALAHLITTLPLAGCVSAGWLVVALPWLVTARDLAHGHGLRMPVLVLMLLTAVAVAVAGPPLSVALAGVERRRLRLVDPRPLPAPYRPAPADLAGWLRVRYPDPATWRAVAYSLVLAVGVPLVLAPAGLLILVIVVLVASPLLVGNGAGPVAMGLVEITSRGQAVPYAVAGVLLLPVLPYLVGLVAAGHAAVTRALLGDGRGGADAVVTSQLREVTRSRARLVDAYEAERRRIERDLHDGAQHRLTGLALQLAMARLDVPDDSPAAEPLDRAHAQAKELMAVLRDLVGGLRPQSLADLGLPGALRELAEQSPVPVQVTVDDPRIGRLSERVETTAYFVAAEALTNIARHSGATHAAVRLTRVGTGVVMEISDDGRGGADPAAGSGLTGLADRVATVDGRLLLASPVGGPTMVRVELPCQR